MGTPADVVKARIMNQPTDKSGRGEYVRVIHKRNGHGILSTWMINGYVIFNHTISTEHVIAQGIMAA